ncbi:hypothetical protein HYH03_005037 [Edaphochlamys debaryana]|uniref:Autophagy-related protein 18 n=1 Tax=Edaphochlamys debaryana TaxID=47281 RepID=A0A836C1R0_9CHLO|nr:hypothetical protein HYH03_005037 [Edaphochlamys debaryana]|eukprot:KAG2497035.1 hypothetical protein HYH03_005037 [Edaphochlamys debaryana]
MLFCSSLVGFVGAGEQPALTPRKLTVMNTSASRIIQELTYPSSVLAVRMNRQRLVVLTAKRAHVYSMQNLACLRTIETEDATQGCCALTTCHEPNLLALPSSATTGTVRIYDLAHEGGNVLSEVQAHQTPVVCLAWNGDGSLLATASTKGTVLRVHRMPSAARSHSFRRGTLAASIQSLAFGPPGLPAQLLVAASSHGTVHVFRLEEPELPGVLPKPASAAAGLLSAVMRYSVGDMVEPARNIATIRLPPGVVQATCAFRQAPLPPDPADAQIGGTEDALPSSPSDAARAQGMGLPGPGLGLASVGSGEARSPPSRSTSVGGAGYGGGGAAAAAAAEARAVIMVATQEGLLYEYSLSDLLNPQGPKCSLEGEWAMLGSGSVLG